MSKAYFSSTLIASSDPANLRMGPSGLQFNGSPVVQVENLFRADYATIYGRADGPLEVSFSVSALFFSEAQVAAFIGSHRESLPIQDDFMLIDDAESVALVMADAVRTINFQPVGRSVRIDYKFVGARFTSEDVPDLPTDTDYVKAKEIALATDDESKEVVFDASFTAKPRFVQGIISAPDGGVAIFAIPRESTRAADRVTFDFTRKVPGAGYVLLVSAIL